MSSGDPVLASTSSALQTPASWLLAVAQLTKGLSLSFLNLRLPLLHGAEGELLVASLLIYHTEGNEIPRKGCGSAPGRQKVALRA